MSDFQKAVDEADRLLRDSKRKKTWRKNACPICGQTIGESQGSGLTGNLRKHVEACERKHKT